MKRLLTVSLFYMVAACASLQVQAQGLMFSGHGAVNRSMGGATTGAAIESIGSLYWNPATISQLDNQLAVDVGLLLPVLETESSVVGLGAGATDAEPGVGVLPAVGWTFRPECSPLTVGLGIAPVAGFATNYPASATNPIFTPQSNAPGIPGGFGQVLTDAAFLEILPVISVQVTDRLSVGIGPSVTIGRLIIDPLVVNAPDDTDGSGVPTYPSGRGTRNHWGGGFQIGAYYEANDVLAFGASYKSPQWMEPFRFKTEDELGLPRSGRMDLDLPMIVSIGTSYSGMEDTLIAIDVRYIDYEHTDGFKQNGFNSDGSIAGVGWDSVLSVALGIQRKLNEMIDVRAGYTANENPIPSSQTQLAVAAPLYYQHQGSVGATLHLSTNVDVNLAYTYAFESEISGPLATPAGPVPGSSITTSLSAHLLNFGVRVKY